jgi:Glycosyltransferase sugar-binding region containing DXD motif
VIVVVNVIVVVAIMRKHSLMAFVPAFGILGLQTLRIAFLTVPEKPIEPPLHNPPPDRKRALERQTAQPPLPLHELTGGTVIKDPCPLPYLRPRKDTHRHESHSIETRKIPKIVHQTSKSRCLTRSFRSATAKWAGLPGWSYYLHDDHAMQRLLETELPEFPLLHKVAQHCLVSGTVQADVWRYLVLWVYGGVYADIDTAPNQFHADTIEPHYDGFFVVEQYHILSQYFMAVSPRHPLMYYAIQHALAHLMEAADTGNLDAAKVTGPHALHDALIDFRKDAGVQVQSQRTGVKPVKSGTYVGTHNRSITVVGVGENENEYVQRSVLKKGRKLHQYKMMNMTHFDAYRSSDKRSNRTCFSALLHASI